jgi:hypothetical protein
VTTGNKKTKNGQCGCVCVGGDSITREQLSPCVVPKIMMASSHLIMCIMCTHIILILIILYSSIYNLKRNSSTTMITVIYLLFAYVGIAASLMEYGSEILFDFTTTSSVDTFYESSDTARSVGMSKGSISLIESEEVRCAVFFSLLNPQPDSACFAGVQKKYDNPLDWTAFHSLSLQSRGQGEYATFKVILKDSQSESNSSLAFEQYFEARRNISSSSFIISVLPLQNFACSYRGASCDERLNVASITTFGFQAAGGVYEESLSQQGVASLEINWVVLN